MIGIYRMVNQPYEYEARMAYLINGVFGVLCMKFRDDFWLKDSGLRFMLLQEGLLFRLPDSNA
jgi:hypothetical protein